jgi:hypothetical protein
VHGIDQKEVYIVFYNKLQDQTSNVTTLPAVEKSDSELNVLCDTVHASKSCENSEIDNSIQCYVS